MIRFLKNGNVDEDNINVFIQQTAPTGVKGLWIQTNNFEYEQIVEAKDTDTLQTAIENGTYKKAIILLKGSTYRMQLYEKGDLSLTYYFDGVILTNAQGKRFSEVPLFYGYSNAWTALPYQHEEREYILSTGTQFIDTKLIPTNHWLEIKFKCTNHDNTGIFAAGTDQTKNYQLSWYYYQGYKWFYAYGTGETGIDYPEGTDCTSECVAKYNYNGELRINNILISNGVFNASASAKSLTLFKREGQNLAKMSLYYCKIYNKSNNNLVMDLVPAKSRDNGKYCLYDKVSGKYFYNAGTGNFSAGGVVEND